MVKLESFDICLDHFNSEYNAGDNVSGIIYLSTSSKHPVKIKDLSVTLIGEAKTSWVNKISDNIYDSTEPIFNSKQTFGNLISSLSDERGNLSPGGHRLPFKFILPYRLPSAYEGEFGYIRYICVAEVHAIGGEVQRSVSLKTGFSTRSKKMKLERSIIVNAQVSINEVTPLDVVLRREGSYETSGCCGVRNGHLDAAISIQRPAYLVGQSILVKVWLDNQLGKPFRSQAMISLIQDVHFRSVSFFQTAADTKTVSRIMDALEINVPERGVEMTKTVCINAAPNLPATSVNDTLIMIRYKLRLEVGNFELILPIGIATKM